jgi:hypothetical protein
MRSSARVPLAGSLPDPPPNVCTGSAGGREQRRRPYAAHGPRPPSGFHRRFQLLFDGLKDDILVDGDIGSEPSNYFAAARDEELLEVPEQFPMGWGLRKKAASEEMRK